MPSFARADFRNPISARFSQFSARTSRLSSAPAFYQSSVHGAVRASEVSNGHPRPLSFVSRRFSAEAARKEAADGAPEPSSKASTGAIGLPSPIIERKSMEEDEDSGGSAPRLAVSSMGSGDELGPPPPTLEVHGAATSSFLVLATPGPDSDSDHRWKEMAVGDAAGKLAKSSLSSDVCVVNENAFAGLINED